MRSPHEDQRPITDLIGIGLWKPSPPSLEDICTAAALDGPWSWRLDQESARAIVRRVLSAMVVTDDECRPIVAREP